MLPEQTTVKPSQSLRPTSITSFKRLSAAEYLDFVFSASRVIGGSEVVTWSSVGVGRSREFAFPESGLQSSGVCEVKNCCECWFDVGLEAAIATVGEE